MKATKLFFAALATLAIASCQNDDKELPKTVTANVQCNIGKGLATRAYNAVWEGNDAIGLFVKENTEGTTWVEYSIPKTNVFASNLEYTTTLISAGTIDGNDYVYFTGTSIPFPSNNHALSFQGYYPYTTLNGTKFTVADWSNQENSKTFDLMISEDPTTAPNCVKNASQVQETKDATIPLIFHHMFSKIILKVSVNEEATTLRTADLAGMTITAAGMNVITTCDVLTRAIDKTGGAVSTPIKFATLKGSTIENAYEAIVCPEYNTGSEDRKVTFTLANGKGTFTWPIPTGTNFESGNSYVWNIRLNGDGVTAELIATIIDWNELKMDENGNIVNTDVIIDVEKQ